jgi:LPXTG-site transpeptidase (sortase) family protein
MKANLGWRLVPVYIALSVFAILPISNSMQHHRAAVAAHAAEARLKATQAALPPLIQGQPSRILLPSLAIDLPIVPGSFDKQSGEWSVSTLYANYAINSAEPNNRNGQTLIYGHNNRYIFGPLLTSLQPGMVAYVYTDNNHIFKYSYVASKDISPNASATVFKEMQKSTGLKLVTCDGSNFEWRHLMSFRLLQAS